MSDLDEYRRRHREAYEARQIEIEKQAIVEAEKRSRELAERIQEEEKEEARKKRIEEEEESSLEEARRLQCVYDAEVEGVRPPDQTYKEQLIEGILGIAGNSSKCNDNNSGRSNNNTQLYTANFFSMREQNSNLASSTKNRNVSVNDSTTQDVDDDEEYARKLQQIEFQNCQNVEENLMVVKKERSKGEEDYPIEILSDDENRKKQAKEENANITCNTTIHGNNNNDNSHANSSYSYCYSSGSSSNLNLTNTSGSYSRNININNNRSNINNNNSNNESIIEQIDDDICTDDALHHQSHSLITDDPDEALLQAAIAQSLNEL